MMDWIYTNWHGFRIKRNVLTFAVFMIVLCLVPEISGQKDSDSTFLKSWDTDNSEIMLSEDKPITVNYHHKRKHHGSSKFDEDTFKTLKHKDEHKKRFHGKNKIHRNKHIDDYDEIAEKRVAKEANIINNLKYLESDKKYFDYFPIEEVKLNYDPKDDDISVVMLAGDDENDVKNKKPKKFSHTRKSRSKRDVKNESNISKRQIYQSNLVENGYPTYRTPNDPWNNRFNTYYPQIQRPVIYNKYPIRGVYHNPISPSRRYLPAVPTMSTTTIASRFGAEDDHVIWDTRDSQGSTNRNEIAPSTRRPPPPVIHRPNRNRTLTVRPPRPAAGITPGSVTNSLDDERFSPKFNTPNQPPRNPSSQSPARPTRRPPPQEPSKCVWAIVSCCSRNNLEIRYSCFEQVGCHGAFWDYNPCADQIQDAAIEFTGKFFD